MNPQTIEEVAEAKGVAVDSVKKKMRRAGMEIPQPGEKLPEKIIEILLSGRRRRGKVRRNGVPAGIRTEENENVREIALKSVASFFVETDWTKVFPVLPLPMLGIAASWGVFHFSAHFVPAPVALVEAAGFELVYIGLSVSKGLGAELYKRVRAISWSAVAVSIVYNSISAGLWAKNGGSFDDSMKLVQGLPAALFWVLAILHGAPLAILGYFVADLNLRKRKGQ